MLCLTILALSVLVRYSMTSIRSVVFRMRTDNEQLSARAIEGKN